MSIEKAILEGIADDLNQEWRTTNMRIFLTIVTEGWCTNKGSQLGVYIRELVGNKSRLRLRIFIIGVDLILQTLDDSMMWHARYHLPLDSPNTLDKLSALVRHELIYGS
jgi:hypothetical protein